MYHHRYGLDAICLRILSCFPRPQNVRMLSTWLSPDDAGRLFEACLTAERPGFRVAFGVSANTRGGWVSLDEARALGYQPRTTRRRSPPRSSPSTASRTRTTRCCAAWAASSPFPTSRFPR